MSTVLAPQLTLTETFACKCGCTAELSTSGVDHTELRRIRRRFIQDNGWHQHGPLGGKSWICRDCTAALRLHRATAGRGRLLTKAEKSAAAKKRLPTLVNITEAVDLYNSGWTLERLGEKYGVTRERVRQVIKGLTVKSRNVNCAQCGVEFAARLRQFGWDKFCTDACRIGRRRDIAKTSQHSGKCSDCGAAVIRGSSRCEKCHGRTLWKWDHDLAAYLYRGGASGPQIAALIGHDRPGNMLAALRKKGVEMRPRGHCYRLPAKDLKRLVAEYRQIKRTTA